MRGLLIGNDVAVAEWAWKTFELFPMHVNRAVGIIEEDGTLVGAAIFQNWNGCQCDLSYYGPDTLTPGIVHCIARVLTGDLDVTRVTAMTSKKNRTLIRGMINLGFSVEGTQKRFYGKQNTIRNTAIRLVMFREDLDRLAGFNREEKIAS